MPSCIAGAGQADIAHDSRRRGWSSLNEPGFKLTKWYFDGVADDGRAFIAYWTSLAWRAIAVTWQDLWLFAPGGSTAHRSSLAGAPPPVATDTTISWNSAQLESQLRVEPCVPPIRTRLLETEHGNLDWSVVAPAARINASISGHGTFAARGYVEVIEMTIAPWRLPIRELRWGRWMNAEASRSVVWVDWRGEMPRTWLFVTGSPGAKHGQWGAGDGARGAAGVSDERVSCDGGELVLSQRKTLHDRRLGEMLDGMPLLNYAVPEAVLGLRQTKWLSDGVLHAAGERATGTAIHEVVVFR